MTTTQPNYTSSDTTISSTLDSPAAAGPRTSYLHTLLDSKCIMSRQPKLTALTINTSPQEHGCEHKETPDKNTDVLCPLEPKSQHELSPNKHGGLRPADSSSAVDCVQGLVKGSPKATKASVLEVLTKPVTRLHGASIIPSAVRHRVSSALRMAGLIVLQDTSGGVKGFWNVFDVDQDGIIDYSEFCRYACDLVELQKKRKMHQAMSDIELKFVRLVIMEIKDKGSIQRAMETIFAKLDKNHSGRISQLEFEEGIGGLGIVDYNFEVHGLQRRFADTSLFILSAETRLRYWAVWLVEWKWFDRFILFCIALNSVMLAFRDYQDPGLIPDINGVTNPSLHNRILDHSESVFSWIFIAECGLKITAMGFLFGRGAYLRSYWNMLDFFVVVVGLISDLPGVPKVSSLRTARVLRPLRTLSNLRGMRMLVYALFSALPALFNVMVILCFVFTVFGILGVLFWNGMLHYRCRLTAQPVNGIWELAGEGRVCGGSYQCPDNQFCGSVYNPPQGTTVDLDKLSSAEIWDYAFVNFDNIGGAVLTLFQCITLEGWTQTMYNIQDAHNYAFGAAYFVTFTIIGAFFLLQFIFAVIWERFNAANDGTAGEWDMVLENRREDTVMATDTAPTVSHVPQDKILNNPRGKLQRGSSFSHTMQSTLRTEIAQARRKNRISNFRLLCRRFILDNYLSGFIVFCILLNTFSLAMDEYPVEESRQAASEILNNVLTVIFSLEMALKLIGLGWVEYRADSYNVFDGIIVLISLIELLLGAFTSSQSGGTGLSALRSFRLFRIMKLARSWRSLRELLQTIANSVADVANFGLLLVLLMYVFALIGMQFFANKLRFDDMGNHVEWEPLVYNWTKPPHAPWTPERPYSIRRSNFDDIIAAFTTVFQCLTEENWNSVMADGARSSGWGAVAYFLIVMVIGNIIILNLFLAILLGNFSMDSQQMQIEGAMTRAELQIREANSRKVKPNAVTPMTIASSSVINDAAAGSVQGASGSRTGSPRKGRSRMRAIHKSLVLLNSHRDGNSNRGTDDTAGDTNQLEPATNVGSCAPSTVLGVAQTPIMQNARSNEVEEPRDVDSSGNESEASNAAHGTPGNRLHVRLSRLTVTRSPRASVKSVAAQESVKGAVNVIVFSKNNRSLFIFPERNQIRKGCNNFVRGPRFEWAMLALICMSSVQLSIDNPLNDPSSKLSHILTTMDNVFLGLFFVEMVLKVIGVGFLFNGPGSYLRDPWNVLDFSILISSSITCFSSTTTLRSLRSFRTLRAMRPLRAISRIPGMRRVVNALLSSIPCIMNVFLVCTLIFLIFGIIGVNLFKGRFYYCDMSSFSVEKMSALETEFGFTKLSFKKLFSQENCINEGGIWTLHLRNYDNVLKSAMTLFEISTTEGWVNLMFQGVDATEIGFHPVQDWNRAYIIFFIVFIIIGSFFATNLFVGAVIDNFNRMRDALNSANETQREWLKIQEMVLATKLTPKLVEPVGKYLKWCFRIHQHPHFDQFIAVSILGNMLMLAITHFGQSQRTASVLYVGNLVFWVVFLVEAVIKLASLKRKYFLNRWNCFDFAVMVASSVSTLLTLTTQGEVSPVVDTLRALRIGLAIRLMKRAQSMQDILNTILDNMPALVNVSTLMCLVMFVYAVIGVQLYAGIMLGDNLDEHANFRTVPVAMLTLFRFTTGEAWNDVMYDLMVLPIEEGTSFPNGTSCVADYSYADLELARNQTGDPTLTIGCSPGIPVVYIYFLSYQLITSYVLLNLFVAVILEGFEETTEKNLSAVTKDDILHACRLWEKYDPHKTGFMSDHEFLKFLHDVPPPLGLPVHARRRDIERWARELKLHLDGNGMISFNSFILSATQHVMLQVAAERGECIIPARPSAIFFAKSYRSGMLQQMRSHNSLRSHPSLVAAISIKRIQAAARAHLAIKHVTALKREHTERCELEHGATETSNDRDLQTPRSFCIPEQPTKSRALTTATNLETTQHPGQDYYAAIEMRTIRTSNGGPTPAMLMRNQIPVPDQDTQISVPDLNAKTPHITKSSVNKDDIDRSRPTPSMLTETQISVPEPVSEMTHTTEEIAR